MSDSGYGSISNGGTVYNGPGAVGTTGTIYGGPTPPPPAAGSTVYNGPAVGGTVYSGPSGAGTVYNGAPAGTTARAGFGNNAVNVGARKGARFFYAIAGITVLRTLLIYFGVQKLHVAIDPDKLQMALVIDLVAAAIFGLIGFFTQNGSKIALVIGMVLYGGDTVLMLFNPAPNAVYIVVHVLFLYYLFNAYRQFAD